MLRKEINELLTQTDSGKPMGDMFRQYWIPALLASELSEDDCPPTRVKLLGERLIAFRDSKGRYGLMDEFCAHRGVSLWFGRNEEDGLRCPYHGWKYDYTGQCIEVPSEPEESGFCEKIKLKGYPLIKVGDILWTHMGGLKTDPLFRGAKGNKYNEADKKPVFEVVESDGGLHIGARRNAEDGHYYWRVTPWIMPSFTMVPPRGDHPMHGHFWIPIDDHNCWAWSFDYHPTRALSPEERQAMEDGYGVHNQYVSGTFRPLQNKDNDYLMDREAQKRGDSYSGIWGIAMQDASLQESMGPIVDRTKENLVSTDNGIIMARHRLRKAVVALRDKGVQPPGRTPEHQLVRSAARVLSPEEPFGEAMQDDLTARHGVKQTSV